MDESIKILLVRHPDEHATVQVWVDGLPAMGVEVVTVDPGAGYTLSAWRGQLAAALAPEDENTRAARRAIREAFERYETSSWITPEQDDATQVEVSCGRMHEGRWCLWST